VSTIGIEVALGLTRYLNQFALDRGAVPYWKWGQAGITQQPAVPRNMHKVFEDLVQQIRTGSVTWIHFNLDGINDPVACAEYAAQGLARKSGAGLPLDWSLVGLTNAELNALRNDPQVLSLTTFYRQGSPVLSPFAGG
jgi:hypothetical protein